MKQISRRNFLGIGISGAAGMMFSNPLTNLLSAAEIGKQKYNVLFIAVDDLRTELNCYGKKVIKSPNIDKLAEKGTLFTRAYCQQALCMPSRSSLLTGRRPDTTKVYDFSVRFRDTVPGVVTLPEQFKKHGYHAQGFGKIFHIDDTQSWSVPHYASKCQQYHSTKGKKVLEYIKSDHRRLTYLWDLGAGFTKTKRPGGLPYEAPNVPDFKLRDGDLANQAIKALNLVKDKPFFLAVGFHKPHLPFIAPKKYWDLYDRNELSLADNPFPPEDVPRCAMYNWNDLRHYYGIPDVGPVSDEQARSLIHGYYACVSFTDAQVGRLINELERLKLREKTIIILWGDHGWQLGEHGMWDKHSNFETSTHSPLIISVPGQKPINVKTNALVEFVDMYPSLCDLCGIPIPEGLEGTSFRPLIENPNRKWKNAAFSQYPRVVPEYGKGMGHSMRTDRYRFTEWLVPGTDFCKYELYDHLIDPNENVNIANRPENAQLVRQLASQLHAGWRSAVPPGY